MSSAGEHTPSYLLDKTDLEFRQNLQIALELVQLIPSMRDAKLAVFWLRKLLQIVSDVPSVKRARNDFLEYFLNVLRDAVYFAALKTTRGLLLTARARLKLKEELRNIGRAGSQPYILNEVMRKRNPPFMSRWSADKKTYVAVQPVPGQGALIYMAASDDGWDAPIDLPPDVSPID